MDVSGVAAIPMLWGDAATGSQDATRLADFTSLAGNPKYVMGFYEPDCSPPMSSDIDPAVGEPMIRRYTRN